ncbi:hypothetical protein KA107_02395 [Candidatus Pacearchaeota archaeon]|nr:hypothetical protein [Candidatus Pacearchaeota archaeon]
MKSKINLKIVVYTTLGLICLYLTYKVDWAFIIGSALAVYFNQRELMKK